MEDVMKKFRVLALLMALVMVFAVACNSKPAEEGAKAYTGIGQMYSSYLGKDSKDRGEENDERSWI